MYLKNKWIAILWKIVIVVVCAYGLSHHMRQGRWSDFNYYTVLSNAVCLAYFTPAIIFGLRRGGKGYGTTWKPGIEKAVVFCISVTFLIYHFVLRPEAFRMGNSDSFYSTLNIIQHYIVPVMVILDWLLFCSKGGLRRWEPAAWLSIPAVYLAYILLRAPIAGNIGATSSPYPYNFMDVYIHGAAGVARNCIIISLGMLMLAYLIYTIDTALRVAADKKSVAAKQKSGHSR